jgi:hypothetical protein
MHTYIWTGASTWRIWVQLPPMMYIAIRWLHRGKILSIVHQLNPRDKEHERSKEKEKIFVFLILLAQRWSMRNPFPSAHVCGHIIIRDLACRPCTDIWPTPLLSNKICARRTQILRIWWSNGLININEGWVSRVIISIMRNEEVRAKVQCLAWAQVSWQIFLLT